MYSSSSAVMLRRYVVAVVRPRGALAFAPHIGIRLSSSVSGGFGGGTSMAQGIAAGRPPPGQRGRRAIRVVGISVGILVAGVVGGAVTWPILDALVLPYLYEMSLMRSARFGLWHPYFDRHLCRYEQSHGGTTSKAASDGASAARSPCLPNEEPHPPHRQALQRLRECLEGADNPMAAGEVIVLTGAAGVGKTTLVRSLQTPDHVQWHDEDSGPFDGYEPAYDRPVLYVSLRAATCPSVLLYGSLTTLLAEPLGVLGSLVVSYQQLYNALFDVVTMNQQHVHVSNILFCVMLGHVRTALASFRDKHLLFGASEESPSSAASGKPGSRRVGAQRPLRRPVIVLDHAEQILANLTDAEQLASGGVWCDPEGSSMQRLLVELLLRSALDDKLCHLIVVCGSEESTAKASADSLAPTSSSSRAPGKGSPPSALPALFHSFPQMKQRASFMYLPARSRCDVDRQDPGDVATCTVASAMRRLSPEFDAEAGAASSPPPLLVGAVLLAVQWLAKRQCDITSDTVRVVLNYKALLQGNGAGGDDRLTTDARRARQVRALPPFQHSSMPLFAADDVAGAADIDSALELLALHTPLLSAVWGAPLTVPPETLHVPVSTAGTAQRLGGEEDAIFDAVFSPILPPEDAVATVMTHLRRISVPMDGLATAWPSCSDLSEQVARLRRRSPTMIPSYDAAAALMKVSPWVIAEAACVQLQVPVDTAASMALAHEQDSSLAAMKKANKVPGGIQSGSKKNAAEGQSETPLEVAASALKWACRDVSAAGGARSGMNHPKPVVARFVSLREILLASWRADGLGEESCELAAGFATLLYGSSAALDKGVRVAVIPPMPLRRPSLFEIGPCSPTYASASSAPQAMVLSADVLGILNGASLPMRTVGGGRCDGLGVITAALDTAADTLGGEGQYRAILSSVKRTHLAIRRSTTSSDEKSTSTQRLLSLKTMFLAIAATAAIGGTVVALKL